MKELKNCAFQYAYKRVYGSVVVVDEVGLTFSKAKDLYQSHRQDIIKKLQDEDYTQIEAALWINMPDTGTFGETYLYITDEYETDGTRIWVNEQKFID